MPQISELFFKTAALFLVLGLMMGLQMSISGQHNVIGAHAHSNLLGSPPRSSSPSLHVS
jgi:hypothetical protein